MTQLQSILDKYLDINLHQIILSGAKDKQGISKVRIRPVFIREKLQFQCTKTVGPKEFHENNGRAETMRLVSEWMEEAFKQLQLDSEKGTVSVLVSKKGKMTLKEKINTGFGENGTGIDLSARKQELSHNRKKKYILEEGNPVGFLTDLGVMTQDGKIVRSRYDKFRQINRFLEFIEDILPKLAKDREVTILDFGCGKSYLTFAMYYYLHELKQYDVRIIGLDLKADVIEHCGRLSRKYGFEKLQFCQGDIASYEGVRQVDMVVTLHACDTATDFALAKAVNWGASVILSVPCCQHELNGQIANEVLEPVFSYGVLKERMAALMTDGLRAQMLEAVGYETQILEFIDMEHTPKNLLIRAVYTGKKKNNEGQLRKCLEEFHLKPSLWELLFRGGSEA
jgi:SAM-dependent methyltransferase